MSLYKDGTTGQDRLQGVFGSFIGNITQALNLTYESIRPSDGRFGWAQRDPEKLDGQLGMVSCRFLFKIQHWDLYCDE